MGVGAAMAAPGDLAVTAVAVADLARAAAGARNGPRPGGDEVRGHDGEAPSGGKNAADALTDHADRSGDHGCDALGQSRRESVARTHVPLPLAIDGTRQLDAGEPVRAGRPAGDVRRGELR